MNRLKLILQIVLVLILSYGFISIFGKPIKASDVPTRVVVLPPGQTALPVTVPVITNIDPKDSDISGGIVVDIWGTDFAPNCEVYFGEFPAQVTYINSGHVKVVVPSQIKVGPVAVRLINSDGGSAATTFSYLTSTVLEKVLPRNVVQALPATGVVTTGGFTLLTVLGAQEFFRLLLIPWFKRKKYWGIVFSKNDLEPVPLTVINLYDAATKRFIKSTISNMQGRFGMIVDPGKYLIEAKHPQYKFDPAPENSTAYHGQAVEINNSKNFTLNIVMQKPNTSSFNLWYSFRLISEKLLGLFEKFYPYITIAFLISDLSFFFMSGDITYFYLSIYMVVLLFIFYVGGWIQPKQWGLILDKVTGKPIPNCYIKLYDLNNPGISETIITDKKGRFELLLSKGRYQLLVNAQGYTMPQNSDGTVAGIIVEQSKWKRSLEIKLNPVAVSTATPIPAKFGMITS